MGFDPVLFAPDKTLDFPFGEPFRRPDHNAVRGDLNADAFPAAADEGVGD